MEKWKGEKKKKQGRNRAGKNYIPRNLMWLFFILNLGSTYAYILVALVSLRKMMKINGLNQKTLMLALLCHGSNLLIQYFLV